MHFKGGYMVPGHGLVDLLKDKGSITGVEIGCDEARTTEYLLDCLPNMDVLYTIDPYTEYRDWNGTIVEDRSNVYKQASDRLSRFGDRVIMIKEESDKSVDKFVDSEFDFIFIDGIHTYEGVISDCRNYYSKVKSGGVFAGHDYGMIHCVRQAVNEFAEEVGISEINQTEVDVWYWIKP